MPTKSNVFVQCLLAAACLAPPLRAQENARQEKVLFYDPDRSVEYAGDVESPIAYFTAYGFKQLNTAQLLAWLEEKLKTGTCSTTVVLQVSDITAKELVLPWDKTSLLYRYCENGGRWVAPSGNTLYTFEGADDFTTFPQTTAYDDKEQFLTKYFGIHRVYGLRGKGAGLTPEGNDWGLAEGSDKWTRYISQGVPAKDVTPLVTSEGGEVALLWYKTINPKYPLSGLIGMCTRIGDSEPMLNLTHRLCLFDGKPTTIETKDWKPKTVTPELAVVFSAERGGIPRKAYQRGEVIPLSVSVSGSQYHGQEIVIRLQAGGNVAWEKRFPASSLNALARQENIDTSPMRCGEYSLESIVAGRTIRRESFWICPERRHNSFPIFVAKMHRKNAVKEELALDYVRSNHVNVNIFDLYQLEKARANPTSAARFGNYLDLILRKNLSAGARPMAMNVYTAKDDEKLLLYDGQAHKHGIRDGMGWRGFVANYLDGYRGSLREQVSLLRDSKSPALVPYFITNDDGSMGGNYDFSPLTLADFTKKTGVAQKALPPLEKMKDGHRVFMPIVPAGVVDDNHPWLQYFRYHCGNYNTIAQAAMEGIQSAWPGSLVGDTGCMSGPLYIPRGFYPPLSFRAYNAASFYQYLFWTYQYPFAIETALMNNRGKPVALEVSASYIAWGPVFQSAVLSRILASAPQSLVLWSLDARSQKQYAVEEETWQGTKSVAGKVANVSEFLKRQEPSLRQGALLFGLAQNCFKTTDAHFRPDYMSSALENFQRVGAELDLLSTEEIMQGRLAQYRIVFINSHQWMTKDEKQALEEYVDKGGVVVADSNTTIDVRGALRADGPFSEGVGDIGRPACLKRCRTYTEPYLPEAVVQPVDDNTIVRVNQVGRVPLAWVLDVESVEDLGALKKAQDEEWDGGVYKYLKAKAEKTPVASKKIRVRAGYHAYDLWNTKELPLEKGPDPKWNRTAVAVDLFNATPVAVYRDRIDKLACKTATESVNRGQGFLAVFSLTSDKKSLVGELVPAAVTVYGPDGREAWEYGGNTIIENGVLTVRFATASNDPCGKWRVLVRELCSGKTTGKTFVLKE